MANETGLGTSGISTAVPAWLRTKALEARYASSKIWKHCMNVTEGDPLVAGQIKQKGDRVTLQIFPVLTASNISTTDGSFTNTAISPTAVSVIINIWRNISADLVDIVDAQAVLQWESEFARAFGNSMGQDQDDQVAALFNDLTNNVDGSGGAFTDAKIRAAQLMLDNRDVPKENRTWAISPGAHADLLSDEKWFAANTTGFSRGIQVGDGRVVGLYGTPVEVTTRITTTSSLRDNCLFHEQAFGIAMQRDFKMEKFARVRYSTNYAGSYLAGVGILRDNHAVWVTSAA